MIKTAKEFFDSIPEYTDEAKKIYVEYGKYYPTTILNDTHSVWKLFEEDAHKFKKIWWGRVSVLHKREAYAICAISKAGEPLMYTFTDEFMEWMENAEY